MNGYFARILALVCLGAALGVSACGDDAADEGSGDTATGPSESDSSASDTDGNGADSSAGTDSEGTESETAELASTHSGWQNANCMSCHDYDGHNGDLLPGDCAKCHGVNGAVEAETVVAHGGAEPAACKCHLPGMAHSPEKDFPSPESCIVCH